MCQSMVSVKMWEKNSILSDYNSQTLDPISNWVQLRSQETLKTSLKTLLKPSSDLLKTLLGPPTSLKPS